MNYITLYVEFLLNCQERFNFLNSSKNNIYKAVKLNNINLFHLDNINVSSYRFAELSICKIYINDYLIRNYILSILFNIIIYISII